MLFLRKLPTHEPSLETSPSVVQQPFLIVKPSLLILSAGNLDIIAILSGGVLLPVSGDQSPTIRLGLCRCRDVVSGDNSGVPYLPPVALFNLKIVPHTLNPYTIFIS